MHLFLAIESVVLGLVFLLRPTYPKWRERNSKRLAFMYRILGVAFIGVSILNFLRVAGIKL